jgi:hypothetical protein
MERIKIDQNEIDRIRHGMFVESVILSAVPAMEKYYAGSEVCRFMHDALRKCKSITFDFTNKYRYISDITCEAYVAV